MPGTKDRLTVPTSEIVQWARTFVRHPSPQTERFEHEPQVQGFVAETVVPLLDQIGLPWRRDGMGNLLVELGPERRDKSLMLMAYAMTHPANRMRNPFEGELIGETAEAHVRGRGISEQKGSLAAALAAVKTAADRLMLEGRLVFAVSTAGETGRHDAAASICAALGYCPRLAVIAIGTGGRVALANKGRIDVVVTVRGKSAHSSTPWMGVDAIEGARRVLERVLAIDVSARKHPLLGAATLTATAVRSWPEATHTVQDEVRITFDRRLLPGDDPQVAFDAVAAAADIGAPWTVVSARGPFMYPAEIAPDGAFMRAVAQGCRGVGMEAPATFASHGALDAGFFCHQGAQSAMWGPGAVEQWHSDDERIAVSDLVTGATQYRGMIEAALC
ncbi:MAG TPA: M20/M25/M40 family metallo-hydrolase [Xanthobacteraceae bacterium]|jgi:acetylornithine deacetylase